MCCIWSISSLFWTKRFLFIDITGATYASSRCKGPP
jgi:hypothetical protein